MQVEDLNSSEILGGETPISAVVNLLLYVICSESVYLKPQSADAAAPDTMVDGCADS